MSKFTEQFTTTEVHWFYRHLQAQADKNQARIASLSGPKVLTDIQRDELGKLKAFNEDISRFINLLDDVRAEVGRGKVALFQRKEEIQEAMELNTSEEAKQHCKEMLEVIESQLANENIKLTLDRNVIKFALKLIEADLEKFRIAIIPKYEQAKDEDFEDPIYTKTYWVAKAKKSKRILEQFKKKLEKGL